MTHTLDRLCTLANGILWRALAYAPATRQRLADMGEQTWRIELTDLELTLDLHTHGSRLALYPPDDRVPDACIRGDSQDFLALLRAQDKTAALAGSGLRVEGSTRSFMQLQDLLRAPDLDWEAALGDLIGDLPASGVAWGARRAWRSTQGFAQGARHATERYLVRETQWLVTGPEIAPTRQRLQQLRRRLERLEHAARKVVPPPSGQER